jgi:putative transposase
MKHISYRRHRFPPIIIQHAVWLYFQFSLSYRDVEDLLAERGIVVSYETIRRWANKFGRQYAKQLRLRRPKPSSTWHIDEVFLKISGKQFYLWRAVDDEGEALDILLQSRRNKVAAVKFFRRIIKRHHATPDIVVTDKWRASMSAVQDILPSTYYLFGKRLNNRAKTHISQLDDENANSSALKHPDRPDSFFQRLPSFTIISTFSDIFSLGPQ